MSGRSRHVWRWRQGLVREEVRSPAVHKMDVDGDEAVDKVHVQALIDTGCLVGDCMSQKIVDSLRASHLIVNIKTTSSSSFDNQCLIEPSTASYYSQVILASNYLGGFVLITVH
jgi:hypothetical protein